MKTTKEIVMEFRDDICGMIADAATRPLKGPELSLALRAWFGKVDTQLARMVEEARRPDPPKAADTPKPPATPAPAKQGGK